MTHPLTDEHLRTLRLLDDTGLLAFTRLDLAACAQLCDLGYLSGDGDGWWRITPQGRRALESFEDAPPGM